MFFALDDYFINPQEPQTTDVQYINDSGKFEFKWVYFQAVVSK